MSCHLKHGSASCQRGVDTPYCFLSEARKIVLGLQVPSLSEDETFALWFHQLRTPRRYWTTMGPNKERLRVAYLLRCKEMSVMHGRSFQPTIGQLFRAERAGPNMGGRDRRIVLDRPR